MHSRVGGVCSLACHGEYITVNREHTVDTIQQHVPRLRGVLDGVEKGWSVWDIITGTYCFISQINSI